jgi:PAS domain-containing protein
MQNTLYKIQSDKAKRSVSLRTAAMVKKPTYEELEAKIKKIEAQIEQRIQTEEDLQELAEKYKLVFEKARDAIFIIQDNVIRFANRRARTVLGYTDEEL